MRSKMALHGGSEKHLRVGSSDPFVIRCSLSRPRPLHDPQRQYEPFSPYQAAFTPPLQGTLASLNLQTLPIEVSDTHRNSPALPGCAFKGSLFTEILTNNCYFQPLSMGPSYALPQHRSPTTSSLSASPILSSAVPLDPTTSSLSRSRSAPSLVAQLQQIHGLGGKHVHGRRNPQEPFVRDEPGLGGKAPSHTQVDRAARLRQAGGVQGSSSRPPMSRAYSGYVSSSPDSSQYSSPTDLADRSAFALPEEYGIPSSPMGQSPTSWPSPYASGETVYSPPPSAEGSSSSTPSALTDASHSPPSTFSQQPSTAYTDAYRGGYLPYTGPHSSYTLQRPVDRSSGVASTSYPGYYEQQSHPGLPFPFAHSSHGADGSFFDQPPGASWYPGSFDRIQSIPEPAYAPMHFPPDVSNDFATSAGAYTGQPSSARLAAPVPPTAAPSPPRQQTHAPEPKRNPYPRVSSNAVPASDRPASPPPFRLLEEPQGNPYPSAEHGYRPPPAPFYTYGVSSSSLAGWSNEEQHSPP